MPNATEQLGIDFSATGLRNILGDIRKLTNEVDAAGKAFDRLYKSAGGARRGKTQSLLGLPGPIAPGAISVNSNGNATANLSGNGRLRIDVRVLVANSAGNLVPAGTRNITPTLGVNGPRQRRSSLLTALQSGKLSSDRYADTYEAFKRNERRLRVPTPQSRVMTALMSTRFNVGHASPLVGRTLEAAGLEAGEAAPMLLAVGAAIAAAKALYDLSKSASDTENAFNRIAMQIGSSAGTTARLSAYGSAAGLSPEATASVAEQIQNRITSDPMAAAAGMRLGVFNLPGMYGNQDYGQQALTVIEHLRSIKDPNERLRLARSVGAEQLLPLSNVSDSQFRYAQQDAAITSGITGNPRFAQDAADFQAAEGRISQAIQNMVAAVGQGEVERLTSAFNGIADLFNAIADWAEKHRTQIDFMTGLAEHLVLGPVVSGLLDMGRYVDNQHSRAIEDNTRATQDNTRAMMQPGTYGRIDRSGYLPGGINGQAIAQGNDIATYQLSTF